LQEWSALGTKIEKALAELSVAQARALRRLRAMVIEHADGIRANAELVDEIDLSAGFAQAAVELNLARPTLHEG
jgi:DNA mismatch repair ATPase MutS